MGTSGLITTANPNGGSHSALLQKQIAYKTSIVAHQLSKADEIEVIESGHNEVPWIRYNKNSTLGWICCVPCIWLRTSATVHKIAITSATLLVTSLLVASPILFLISTAPSQLPRDCLVGDEDCLPTVAPPPECTDPVCKIVASNIQAKLNWNIDPCVDFKNFSCSSNSKVSRLTTLRPIRSAQESVDLQIQRTMEEDLFCQSLYNDSSMEPSKEKRPRSSNFTSQEEDVLISLVQKYSHKIENKKTNAVSWQEKKDTWQKIATDFSSQCDSIKSSKNLKDKYENLKRKAKTAISSDRNELYKTGGGSYISKSSSKNDERISSLLGKSASGLFNEDDCDKLLQHNTTTGPFRKLGRLFGSCLRHSTNSSTIRLVLDQLGGYLPIGALGPSSISVLISKINKLGPTPLVDIYYDLSYGKRPQVLLIISGPSTASPILENKIRWMGPKAPPYRAKEGVPILLNDLLQSFLPSGLTQEQKLSENEAITTFIRELNKIRVEHSRRGFWESSVLYNISTLQKIYPILNWTSLIPSNWSGPIVVRNSDYLKAVEELLTKYPTRVAHNSLLVLFGLTFLPQGKPSPSVCTRATMWALPDITSALFIAQHSSDDIRDVILRTDVIFKSLKAHLKRAPSLKGAALVKLSALKIQSEPWNGFSNITMMIQNIESMEISSDNWFENVLKICHRNKAVPDIINMNMDSHDAWAYPIVAKIFYDTLSHSIVVPLSVILVPYFDGRLPPYLQYASVGVAIAKEILRSITKSFEEKAMRCVPKSVNIFSNYSRMDILIHSGGMQISYHSMLSLTGPIKGMARLPRLNLTPTQIFFLVSAQELCAESDYTGIDTDAPEFQHILGWLIAQGGSATEVFKCPIGSMINAQRTCNVL